MKVKQAQIIEYLAEDATVVLLEATVEAGAASIDVKVTGEVNKIIEWKAETIFSEVTY